MKRTLLLPAALFVAALDAAALCKEHHQGFDRTMADLVPARSTTAFDFRRVRIDGRTMRDCRRGTPAAFNQAIFRIEGRVIEWHATSGNVKLRILDANADPFTAWILTDTCTREHPLRDVLNVAWGRLHSRLPGTVSRITGAWGDGTADIPIIVEGFGYYHCGNQRPDVPWLSPITKVEFPDTPATAPQKLDIQWSRKKQ